jgi:hypothetical protein
MYFWKYDIGFWNGDDILMQEGSKYEPRERERQVAFDGGRNLKGEHVSACLMEGWKNALRKA